MASMRSRAQANYRYMKGRMGVRGMRMVEWWDIRKEKKVSLFAWPGRCW